MFDRLRMLLRDELGTIPSPDAIAAHERLLRPEPARGSRRGRRPRPGAVARSSCPAELVVRAGGAAGRTQARAGTARAAVVARRATPERLRARGAQRQGRAAGRGSRHRQDDAWSRRSPQAAHDAGALVLAGRSPRRPWSPTSRSSRRSATTCSTSRSRELRVSAREYGTELARLIPELRRRAPDLPPPVAARARDRALPAVRGGRGAARRDVALAPVLLVLDDLQWADRPTLLLLRHLARAPNPARLLILGAYRATERRSHGFADALARDAPRAARHAARHPWPGRARDRRARAHPSRGRCRRARSRVRSSGDRGQPVLRRGDRPPPRRGGSAHGHRRRPRAPAVRASGRGQGRDRAAARPARPPGDRAGCAWPRSSGATSTRTCSNASSRSTRTSS